ncbi:MAG TPA: tripartite tricarboxylate transporter substrate-binding protein [Pseudolabrys sp.]|nr:tripartite tricarboxylate transporter substrate-binding protein [Pseudolabrys sp.]
MICSTPAGNGPDVIARIVADGLTRLWGERVVVENRPGGRAIIATLAVKKSVPDGYTLYVALGSTFVILPEIHPDLPFDLQRDIVPIGLIAEQPFAIAVDPKLGLNSLADLIALARKRQGELLYGTIRASAPHLATVLFLSQAGIRMKFVAYPNTAKAVGDVMSGTVSAVVESVSGLRGAIAGGQIKALAVSSAKRLPEFPDLPTIAETIPGYTAKGWFALMAPAGTPDAIRKKVNADLNTVLAEPEVKQKLASLGTYSHATSPAETAQYIAHEQALWKPVIKRMHLMN